MDPCIDYCFNHFGKEYTKDCDNNCEYAKAIAENKKLQANLAHVTAERDAAIKDIWAVKWVSCKYGTDCDFISAMTGFPDCAGCSKWEWRGIKED